MNTTLTPGFLWDIELYDRFGALVDKELIHNLMPTEGMNHTLNVVLKSATPVATWYVLLYEGNYTPVVGDTAATFPSLATECTTYSETTRVAYVPGTVAAGAVDNSASPAVFTSTADKTIYGGAIVSVAAKGSTSGVITSAVRFSTSKAFTTGSIIRVTAAYALT